MSITVQDFAKANMAIDEHNSQNEMWTLKKKMKLE